MNTGTFLNTPIFLIGMMGSGKSYYGTLLATAFNVSCIDIDSHIEQQEQQTIAQIFASKGEAYFRQLEHYFLQSLSNSNTIVATGGGTPCFYNNMELMNAKGITIFLNESITILTERLIKGKAHRPLISNLSNEEVEQFITQKLTERLSFYQQSAIHIVPSNFSDEAFVQLVKQQISQLLKR